jgi:hypothetical protein
VPTPTLAGAPDHSVGAEHGNTRILAAPPGQSLDQGQLEKFREMERAKGNVLREVAPGVWVVEPSQKGNKP